jgi:hypothetical protein
VVKGKSCKGYEKNFFATNIFLPQMAGAEPESYDQSPDWRPEETPLGDGRTLVLDPT